MIHPFSEHEFAEPERYELHEGPYYVFEISRRTFVQVVGTGILISAAAPSGLAQRLGAGNARPALASRLHIDSNGQITVLTSKVEVGQGSRTQLSQAAAEELGVGIERVQLIMADSAVVPDDGGTAGSRTTPSTVPAVRRACAAARLLLIERAAAAFKVDAKGLDVQNGQVTGLPNGQQYGYAQLAQEKAVLQREVSPSTALREVHQWKVLGQSVSRVEVVEIVTGAHKYPSDLRRPDMLYGKILRLPSYGAQLQEIDLDPARAIPGVVAIRDGQFVGFAAPTSYDAERAREAAGKTAKWALRSWTAASDRLSDYLRKQASPRSRRDVNGAPDEIFKNSGKVFRQTYDIAYIQHAPMEPRAALAEWKGDHLTVWTGTQQPARVRDEVAAALRVPRERVRVIVPDTGGGFGGKHSGEAAVEAARLSLAAKKAVSIRWTREEEFTWAYFRPAGVIDLTAALDQNGALIAWEHINYNSGASAIGTPYQIPNTATEFKSCDQPLRSGSYRALASTANAFARESFMDELAAELGVDPLEFRLRHLTNERLRNVLLAATDKFGWKRAWRPQKSWHSTGIGLACGIEKGSFVACCAEIELDQRQGTFRVRRVTEAYECGAIQNPANLRAQVEGCIIQGLGGALTERIEFKDGRVLNPRFSAYLVPRFKDVPAIETVLLNRLDLPSAGAGETPIIGIAPALANALFHAAQVRIRALPIRNSEWRASA